MMPKFPLFALMATLVVALAAAPSLAADYSAGKDSTLGFKATYMDDAFEGRFADFTPLIRFDPADLAGSRFDVRIRLDSASTANQERDEMLVGPEFFNAGAQPEARYQASSFTALGGNRYRADGTLALNGVSRPVALTFEWTPGLPAVLEGQASLKRLDFKVGQGDWTDTGLLPDQVQVFTRLELQPKP
jgi:polyisoprenoid-binding protein YceI